MKSWLIFRTIAVLSAPSTFRQLPCIIPHSGNDSVHPVSTTSVDQPYLSNTISGYKCLCCVPACIFSGAQTNPIDMPHWYSERDAHIVLMGRPIFYLKLSVLQPWWVKGLLWSGSCSLRGWIWMGCLPGFGGRRGSLMHGVRGRILRYWLGFSYCSSRLRRMCSAAASRFSRLAKIRYRVSWVDLLGGLLRCCAFYLYIRSCLLYCSYYVQYQNAVKKNKKFIALTCHKSIYALRHDKIILSWSKPSYQ